MSISPTGDRSGALAAFGVQVGPQAGEEVPIRAPVVTIGRGAQNDVVLADDSVSTMHARLEYEAGHWRITDLDSVNGTYVEGVKLAPEVPTPLAFGSTVRLGGARLHFRAVDGADPDSARASYAPPARERTVRERRGGLRLPVWLLAVLLVLAAVAALLLYGLVAVGPPAPELGVVVSGLLSDPPQPLPLATSDPPPR